MIYLYGLADSFIRETIFKEKCLFYDRRIAFPLLRCMDTLPSIGYLIYKKNHFHRKVIAFSTSEWITSVDAALKVCGYTALFTDLTKGWGWGLLLKENCFLGKTMFYSLITYIILYKLQSKMCMKAIWSKSCGWYR